MRILCGFMIALAVFQPATSASAIEVFATSIFSPVPDTDEDPTLSGLMKIDLATGVGTTFIAENAAVGFSSLADVAVGPHDGLVYVATQLGLVFRFDPITGDPLPGETNGVFAQLFGAGNGLLFADDGTLYVSEIGATGSVAVFDTAGVRQAGPTDLDFPAGLALKPTGELLVATGGIGALGSVQEWDGSTVSTLISPGTLGGVIDLTILNPVGDYNGSGLTDGADQSVWSDRYGQAGTTPADGNGDGVVDAADYTVWRDDLTSEARILTTDFFANGVASFALDGTDRQTFIGAVPPEIPAELPPFADFGSNFPSEILIAEDGSLLLSTLGLTRRPDNRGAVIHYDRDGNLIEVLAEDLPPISGIALVPAAVTDASAVPEPVGLALALLGLAPFARSRRGTR